MKKFVFATLTVLLFGASPVKWTDQYPEILYLAEDNVQITQEASASFEGSHSEQLIGKKYVEFDRTLMTLHCLELFLDGSDAAYEELTAAQPASAKLSREAFDHLHEEGQALLDSEWKDLSSTEMKQAMEVGLVLGDIGKSDKARELFESYGASAPDHDDFHDEVMEILQEFPELSPSYFSLPEAGQELLYKTSGLAHFGHITHLEGGIHMFDSLFEREIASEDPTALSFELFIHTCDVAGALGHINCVSSLVYTQETHRAMQAMADAVRLLEDPSKTSEDAYNFYVATRATWLELDENDPLDRVLSRIGAMLRLFTPPEGQIIKKTVNRFDETTLHKIVSGFDEHSGHFTTPTYMPAVLVNLTNHPKLGRTREERLSKAISLGLPFLARVLEKHQKLMSEGEFDPNVPLNFNPIAGAVKDNPYALRYPFSIQENGHVVIDSSW